MVSLISESLLEKWSHIQACEVKPRDHSFRHVSEIVRKVNTHVQAQSRRRTGYTLVKSTSIEWGKLQFMLTNMFKGWRRIKGCKCKEYVKIKKCKHQLIGRIHMKFHDLGEKFNMSTLENLSYQEMNEDKVDKRRLWSKFFQFSHQYVRIPYIFCGLDKILAMPTKTFNVSSVEEPTLSININHNNDPQNTQNSKDNKRIQNVFVNQEELEIFFH